MPPVAIVVMPFASLRWPTIGPSLLKAGLSREGIGCDVVYANFDFAERVGWDDYLWLCDALGFVLGGERLFARHYFHEPLPDDETYFREVLLPSDPQLTAADLQAYVRLARHVGPFLEHCRRQIDWSQYAIVGFTSTFQQTLPGLCLARWIKQRWPEKTIVFGGSACEGPMGRELSRRFPEIDYVFLGEADVTFPRLVRQILAAEPVDVPEDVAVGHMQNRNVVPSPPVPLDDLAFPDFDDYFARLARSPLAGAFEPNLFFEASRGCWWGQKHHCVFCGLNGSRMAYRSKRPERVLEELTYLVRRHKVYKASSADNIFDHRYFQTLLPALREAQLGLGFVFEMKTNVTRPQVEQLLQAGLGAVQLGIETFSTPLLKLIDKGATATQNVQALKWFSEGRIEVKWNLLYGFPGEDPAEYRALAELLPLLVHLAPPLGTGQVRADRFSPYFQRPEQYGIARLRPMRAFRYAYPFPEASLAELAYYFDHDFADGRNVRDYVAPLLAAVEDWLTLAGTVTLRAFDRGDGTLLLTDTRPCATAFQHRLTGLARDVYLACDAGQTLGKLCERVAAEESAVARVLGQLQADRLLIERDARYLALATRAPEQDVSGARGM